MKRLVLLGLVIALAQGVSYRVCSAQPECTEVYFIIDDPGQDPPCGITPTTNWSIHVTTSPTSTSAGTCSGFTLDNRYANVTFYSSTCGSGQTTTCNIIATASILSGYYQILTVNGSCFRVCQTCTP